MHISIWGEIVKKVVDILTQQVYLASLRSFVNAHAQDLNRMWWNIEYLISQFKKELSVGGYTSVVAVYL